MAEGMNKVFLLGNLGAEPELRFTQNGNAVLNMRLATSERFKDNSGEWKDRTEWHSVVVWGKRGEGLAKILTKGSRIMVEGSLRTTSYEARDGGKRYKTEVNAYNVLLAGGDRRQSSQRSSGFADERPRQQQQQQSGGFDDGYGEGPSSDVPF